MREGSRLGDRTSPDMASSAAVLAVPVGATEQHGPHLPLSTDTDIAVALADGLADRSEGILVAPAIPYGASGEHQAFPGTISIGQHATELLLIELARSATETFPRVLFVSAHGGNAKPVGRAVRRLLGEGRDVRAWCPEPVWQGDAHAGRTETSLLLALAGGRVRTEQARAGNTEPLTTLIGELRTQGVAVVAENGVLGDPAGASAEEGDRLLAEAAAALATAVAGWRADGRVWL